MLKSFNDLQEKIRVSREDNKNLLYQQLVKELESLSAQQAIQYKLWEKGNSELQDQLQVSSLARRTPPHPNLY